MIPALVLVLLLSLPFLWVLARRPVLRRLAVRNALRRPREAALVVLGSLLGAAIITGSMVVGDTMNASIRQVARTHLGPIDEIVSTRGPMDQGQLMAGYKSLVLRNADVDGMLAIAWMDGAVTTTGPRLRSAPRAQVLGVDFAAARHFGGDAEATGVSGATPAIGHAAISSDLAGALGVAPGATIAVRAFGLRNELVVDRILPRRGIAGFWLGAEQESPNVLVSPATFDRITSGAASGVPPTWAILVSNRGGVESGASRTDRVVDALRAASPAPPLEPQIYAAKQTTLETADAVGKGFSSMFTAMGSFGVLAGLLLLVNLFVMLAAERKTELGMARAVGMRRSELVAVFSTEGWFYALTATALGVLTGIGLGRVLVAVSARIFSTEHNRFDLFFTVQPRSLSLSFAIGFTVALLTIVLTSVQVSRLNIIRAIRDLEEPPRRQGRLLWVGCGSLLAGLGVVATLQGAATTDGFGLLLGPTLIVAGLAPLAARFLPAHAVNTAAAMLVVVWGATLFGLVPSATKGASVMLYVVQGIVLTAAAVVLLSLQQDRVSRALRFLTGGRSLALRLGLAYPVARRSRTGLTIAMYALVVFILTFITSLAHMIDQQVDTATRNVQGGYSVILASSPANPVHPAAVERLDGVVTVAPLARSTVFFRAGKMTSDSPWNMTAFDQRFVDGGPPKLEDRGSYRTDWDAWNAVLHDDSLVIVEPTFLQTSGGPSGFLVKPGSKVVARDPYSGRTRTLTVAALSPSDYFIENGAFYGADGAQTFFGYEPVFDRLLIALRPDVGPEAFADDAQAAFLENGAEATSIRAIMDEGFTMTRQIFQLFEGYLAMGLIVGIAGTAVVMIRAVRERRRQIGTLRALGFGARPVGRSFAIESAFIAIEGTVIGALLALVTLYDIVSLSDSFGQLTFSVPYLQLGVLLTATVAASLLATVWPAASASRIRPAVALRTTD